MCCTLHPCVHASEGVYAGCLIAGPTPWLTWQVPPPCCLAWPCSMDEPIVNGWLFIRYLVVGLYVGLATAAGFIWWYLSAGAAAAPGRSSMRCLAFGGGGNHPGQLFEQAPAASQRAIATETRFSFHAMAGLMPAPKGWPRKRPKDHILSVTQAQRGFLA